MSIHNSNIAEDVKVLMLKGEKGDTGYPTDDQVSEALETLGEPWVDSWLDDNASNPISDWLDEHPEATTTVQDGSLTYEKLVVGTLGFVTPEMLGAKGDGVTDDTTAWQTAVDFGVPVKATKKKYKCGQINVTKNIDIDCNGAEFICTGARLFYCTGEVVATLDTEADYTANQIDYSISSVDYADYTGFAMLKGTNNFELARPTYLGGFVAEFWNGKITTAYPIDVTGVSIEIVNPITVHIHNVGNISHSTIGNTTYSITISYGLGCVIENCNMAVASAYSVITFYNCLNCICQNCNIEQELGSVGTNSYLVMLGNSSFCTVRNCQMYNKYWHCVTIGDTYLCYHNRVDNCKLFSETEYAYGDHENGVNSIITNCVCTNISVASMAVVDNCTILPLKTTQKHCLLRIGLASDEERAIYNISNIRFMTESGGNTSYQGIWFAESTLADTTGTYYIKECNFTNIWHNYKTIATILFSLSATFNHKISRINVDNCNLYVYLGIPTTATNYDISDYVLTLSNFNTKCSDDQYLYPVLGASTLKYNEVRLNNVKLKAFAGTFSKLFFSNLYVAQTMSAPIINDELSGTGLKSKFSQAMLGNPTFLNITDMKYSSSLTLYNLCYDPSSEKRWCWRYVGSTMSIMEIPN